MADLLKLLLAVAFAAVLVWKVLGGGKLRRYLRRVQGKA
jgi:hypothetical protein